MQPPSLAEVESKILPAYLRKYRELADGLGSFAAIERPQMAGRFSVGPWQVRPELRHELHRLYPAFWDRARYRGALT